MGPALRAAAALCSLPWNFRNRHDRVCGRRTVAGYRGKPRGQHFADRLARQRLCARRRRRRPSGCRHHDVAVTQADASATLRDLCCRACFGRARAGLWPADGREGPGGCFARLLSWDCCDRRGGERSFRAERPCGVSRVARFLGCEPGRRAWRDSDRPRARLARCLLDVGGDWRSCRTGSSALDASSAEG
jgi:hypothetical protein